MELTRQHANDINEILKFSVEMGFLKNFDVSYYHSTKHPELSLSYIYYLTGLLQTYMKKYDRNWIYLDGKVIACNNHTEAFCNIGGFMKVYEDEMRQEMKEKIDLSLAQKTLKTYKSTQIVAWTSLGISVVLFILQLLKIFKII